MALIFNSVNFRDPNDMKPVRIFKVNEWRSFNNTLNRDIISFNAKNEYEATFMSLTGTEFTTLLGYCEGNTIPVSSNVTGHTFSFASASVTLISAGDLGFGGRRNYVKISIKEV